MPDLTLLTTAEMAEADRRAVALGVPSLTLMENAGRAVADEAARLVPPGASVAVLAGPGNNGGDGFVAARLLAERGFDVRVACLAAPGDLKGDAAVMAGRWQGATDPLSETSADGAELVIDALFGAGLSRPLEGVAASLVARLGAARRSGRLPIVLSVDVPSGLDGTTGQVVGGEVVGKEEPVVQATRTVTFFRRKPGHLLLPGRMLCGEVVTADIGIPAEVAGAVGARTCANSELLWLAALPRPREDGHKYSRGHAVVVSGSAEASGAARLAGRGALRIGAGLVTLVGGAAATAVNAVHTNAIMVHRVEGAAALAEFLEDARRNAVLIGPGAGVGADTAADVLAVLGSGAAVVLDADALTSFAGQGVPPRRGPGFVMSREESGTTPADLYAAIAGRSAPVVLTPHDGEFGRLFGALAGSRLDRARAAAATSGAVVILKGADTVITAPDGRAAINENAPPWLATAGAGDVLAGFVTGLLAQGMPVFEAACAAVWLHGAAASAFGPGLIAEDLPEVLPKELAKLYARSCV